MNMNMNIHNVRNRNHRNNVENFVADYRRRVHFNENNSNNDRYVGDLYDFLFMPQ